MCNNKSIWWSFHSEHNTSFRFLSKSLCFSIHLNGGPRVFTCNYKSLCRSIHLNYKVCSHAATSPSVEASIWIKRCVHMQLQVPLWKHPPELHHVHVQSTWFSVEASIWTSPCSLAIHMSLCGSIHLNIYNFIACIISIEICLMSIISIFNLCAEKIISCFCFYFWSAR